MNMLQCTVIVLVNVMNNEYTIIYSVVLIGKAIN
jgi:hypothetical protein